MYIHVHVYIYIRNTVILKPQYYFKVIKMISGCEIINLRGTYKVQSYKGS